MDLKSCLRKILKSTELKIFISFSLIFLIFIHWGGVNSYSRYNLTRAIVEDKSTEITKYHHNTVDKVVTGIDWQEWEKDLKEHILEYERLVQEGDTREIAELLWEIALITSHRPEARIFSDKAPLSSFLAVPAYVLADWVSNGADTEQELVNEPLSQSTKLKQFLITVFVSVFFGALLLVLLYRFLKDLTKNKTIALMSVFVAGLATPLFYYSTVYFGTITATLLGFLSFYLLFSSLNREKHKNLFVCGAGIVGGLAIATEYYLALIPLGLSLYLLVNKNYKGFGKYALCVVLGMLPLFIYNMISFGNPLAGLLVAKGEFPAFAIILPESLEGTLVFKGFVLDFLRNINVAIRLLFYPLNGLFFYSPVLLLSLIGSYRILKTNKKLLIIFPGIFILFLIFNSSWIYWYAGHSFGPRYLVPALPFLLVPLAFGLKEISRWKPFWKRIGIGIVVVLFGISFFQGLLGFNQVSRNLPDLPPTSEDYLPPEEFGQRFKSFAAIDPDFYPGLIAQLQRFGPRSELLMSFSQREKGFDISYSLPYGPEKLKLMSLGDSFLFLDTRILPILILFLVLFVFWGHLARGKFYFLFLLLIIILFASFVSSSSFAYGFIQDLYVKEQAGDGFASTFQPELSGGRFIIEPDCQTILSIVLKDWQVEGF